MPALPHPELAFGQLALLERAITAEHLAECLADQEERARRGRSAPPLADLLVERGALAPAVVSILRARLSAAPGEMPTRMPEVDGRFERRVLTEGRVAPAAFDAAVRLRGRLADLGMPLGLAEILVGQGILTPDQARDLRSGAGPDAHASPSDGAATVRPDDLTRLTVAAAAPSPAPAPPDRAITAAPASSPAPPPASAADGDAAPSGHPFGRYRLLRELGRGGMGVVHQAWDTELRRNVALKLLLDEGGPECAADIERFQREAQAAARLRHPGIVQVHDVGSHAGRHYFTMDFIAGTSLEAVKQTLPLRRFIELLRDVATALHAAHAAGIVHRDVKPQNILLDGSGRAYVTDFGLAKQVSADAGMRGRTIAGQALGTPQYMSPEQAQGQLDRIGPASDVWSLGVILYERLAGRFPFTGVNLFHLLGAIVAQEPPAPSRLPGRRVQRDLETICLKCLEKRPERRYAHAATLAEELVRFLAGEPIEARPATVAYRVQRWVARRPGTVAALGGLGLLAAALLLSAGETRRQAARAVREAQARAALEREVTAQVREKAGMLLEIAIDQRRRGVLRHADGMRLLAWIRAAVKQADERVATLADPHYRLGVMLNAVGEAAEADAELTTALDRAGGDVALVAAGRYERGMVRAERYRRRLEEKRSELLRQRSSREPEKVVEPPSDEEVERAYASVAAARQAAAEDLEAAVAVHGPAGLGGARADAARGMQGLLRGDPAERVEADLQSALAHDRFLPEVYLTLAGLSVRRREFRPAADWCERGLALDRAHEGLIRECASALMLAADAAAARGAGQDAAELRARALKLLEDRLAVDPDFGIGWTGVAMLRWRIGEALQARGEDPRAVYRSALDAAGRALALDPRNLAAGLTEANLQQYLANVQAEHGEDPEPGYRAALAGYGRALAVEPGFPEAVTNRALVHFKVGRWRHARGIDPRESYRAAIAEGDRALALDPNHAGAVNNRANAYWSQGDWQLEHGEDPRESYRAALAGYDRALALDPNLTEAVNNRASVCSSLGRWQSLRGEDPEPSFREALAGYDRALALNPNYVNAAHNRSNVLVDLGNAQARRGGDPRASYQASIEASERALAIHPNLAEAASTPAAVHYALGRWLEGRGEDPEASHRAALAACDRALAINPNLADAANLQALAEVELARRQERQGEDARDRFQAALAACERALAIHPDHPAATNSRGVVHQVWGECLAGRGNDPLDQFLAALESYRRALAIQPENPMPEYNRAGVHRALGDWRVQRGEDPAPDYRAALAGYERTLALVPTHAGAANLLAVVHYNLACALALASAGRTRIDAAPAAVAADEAAKLRDEAFAHLDRAVACGWDDRAHLDADPDLATLRDDPRWGALRERFGK